MLSVYPVLRDDDILEGRGGLQSTVSTFSPYVDLAHSETYDQLIEYLQILCTKPGASRFIRLAAMVMALKATAFLVVQATYSHCKAKIEDCARGLEKSYADIYGLLLDHLSSVTQEDPLVLDDGTNTELSACKGASEAWNTFVEFEAALQGMNQVDDLGRDLDSSEYLRHFVKRHASRSPQPELPFNEEEHWPTDFGTDDPPQLSHYEESIASEAPTPLVTPANSRPASFDCAPERPEEVVSDAVEVKLPLAPCSIDAQSLAPLSEAAAFAEASQKAATEAKERASKLRQVAQLCSSEDDSTVRVSRQIAAEFAEKCANDLASEAGLEQPFLDARTRRCSSVEKEAPPRGFIFPIFGKFKFWKQGQCLIETSTPVNNVEDVSPITPAPPPTPQRQAPTTPRKGVNSTPDFTSASPSARLALQSPSSTVTPASLASSLESLSVSSRKFRRRGAIPFRGESNPELPSSPGSDTVQPPLRSPFARTPVPAVASPGRQTAGQDSAPHAIASTGGQKASVQSAAAETVDSIESLKRTVELAEQRQVTRMAVLRAEYKDFMRIVCLCKETPPGSKGFTDKFERMAPPENASPVFWTYWNMAEEVGRQEAVLAFDNGDKLDHKRVPEVFKQALQSRRERLVVKMRYTNTRGTTYSRLLAKRIAEMRQKTKRMEAAWEAQKRRIMKALASRTTHSTAARLSSATLPVDAEGSHYLPTAANVALVRDCPYSKRARIVVWNLRREEEYNQFKAQLSGVGSSDADDHLSSLKQTSVALPTTVKMAPLEIASLQRPAPPPPGTTAEQRLLNRPVYDRRLDISFARQAMADFEITTGFGDNDVLDCGIDSAPFEDEDIVEEASTGPSSGATPVSATTSSAVLQEHSPSDETDEEHVKPRNSIKYPGRRQNPPSPDSPCPVRDAAEEIVPVACIRLSTGEPVTPPKVPQLDAVTPPQALEAVEPAPHDDLTAEQKRTLRNRKNKEAKKRAKARKSAPGSIAGYLEPIDENSVSSPVTAGPKSCDVFSDSPTAPALRPFGLASKVRSTVVKLSPPALPPTPPTPSRRDVRTVPVVKVIEADTMDSFSSEPSFSELSISELPSFSASTNSPESSFEFNLDSPSISGEGNFLKSDMSFEFGSQLAGPVHSTPLKAKGIKELDSLPLAGSVKTGRYLPNRHALDLFAPDVSSPLRIVVTPEDSETETEDV